mmetsp:Transcript_46882/g.118127  ORF Transcript_46882/g.118127 Transcript_46882/m.118127 type:complete len:133 (+) Transcript_46882:730-1128(+)
MFDESILADEFGKLLATVQDRARALGETLEYDTVCSIDLVVSKCILDEQAMPPDCPSDAHVMATWSTIEALATFRDAVAFSHEFAQSFNKQQVEDYYDSFMFNPDDFDFVHDVVEELGLQSCIDDLVERISR